MAHGFEVVKMFEAEVAVWTEAKYAIAVESCSMALMLGCAYYKSIGAKAKAIHIPARTYPSVPCAIIHAGFKVKFDDKPWDIAYRLDPLPILDASLWFKPGMHGYGVLGMTCLSFHSKKLLPIGRGGMILTNNADADKWLRRARIDGRSESPLERGDITMVGWNAYMSPEQAARGLELFAKYKLKKEFPTLRAEDQGYPDLSKLECYR